MCVCVYDFGAGGWMLGGARGKVVKVLDPRSNGQGFDFRSTGHV